MIKLPSLSTRSRSDTRQLNPEHALVSLHHPRSAASEAYRMLRTNIHFSAGGDELKVIQVTSAFPGEGKSLTASNLAITFAQAGSNVVLVDADMRRSNTHKQFELPASPGLSEAIVTGNIEASIKPGPIEGLSIVTAGTEPPNPSELLTVREPTPSSTISASASTWSSSTPRRSSPSPTPSRWRPKSTACSWSSTST